MIVGMALKKVFEGKTINDVSVQFHFGDQKEFNAWVVSKMKSGKQKYPLIWYVITEPEPKLNNKLGIKSKLILFQGTKSQIFNNTRFETTYLNYLEPLYHLVSETLNKHKLIRLYDRVLKYKDEPNFGIDSNSTTDINGVDIVDAKIIYLNMDICAKCILEEKCT